MAQSDQEFDFLDLLLIVAGRAKLLVLGPVLVGLLAWGVTLIWPPTYESTAWLRLEEPAAAQIMSRDVLAATLQRQPWIAEGVGQETGIRRLLSLIDVRFNRQSGMVELITQAPTPQQAQDLNNTVVDAYRAFSRPKGQDLERINAKIQNTREALQELQAVVKPLTTSLSKTQPSAEFGDDRVRTYAQLSGRRQELQDALFDMEQSLRGFGPEVYAQVPRLPERPVKPKKGVIIVLAVVGSGMLLLFGVLVVGTIQAAARHGKVAAEKLQKLKGSLREQLPGRP